MNSAWREQLDRAVDQRFEQIVEIRRHLHAHPEPSGEEHETTLFLYQLLGNEGLAVRQGKDGRGVVSDLATSNNSTVTSRLALRADIDALHIHDEKQVPYRSRREGVMHACGHDAHSAILSGALLALSDAHRTGQLPWPVRIRGIYQPAEETCQGAREMIESEALNEVDAILALHVDPARPAGHIGIRRGVLTANCDEINITIRGRGGHAARPHEASDPITAAAELINSLYLHVPRATDSQDAVVVTIGKIEGGDNSNVIPEEVRLCGTVRTLDREIRRLTMDHIERLVKGTALTTDTKIDFEFGASAPSVDNDRALVKLLTNVARDLVGPTHLEKISRPSMGSEDFAFYLDHVPGAMFRLGCTAAEPAKPLGLHTTTFDIDEETLRVGAKLFCRFAVEWSRPDRDSDSSAAQHLPPVSSSKR